MLLSVGMRYSSIAGLPLAPSVISLGVADHGTAVSEEDSFRLMDLYFSQGGNLFDTAHVYAAWLSDGHGVSERTLGKWIRSRGLEKKVLVCTKGAHPDMKTRASRMSERAILSDLSESLDRLGLPSVDLYLLHRDDPSVPVEAILGWLESLRKKGLIRVYGSSNWSPARQREAASLALKNGYTGFQISQIGFSLATAAVESTSGTRYMDAETRAFHEETGFPLMAFSSQANGFFSGRYSPANPAGPDGSRPGVAHRYGSSENFKRLALATKIAREQGVSSNQVALAWLLQQPFPTIAVVGAKSLVQLEDSLGSAAIELSEQDWVALLEARPL